MFLFLSSLCVWTERDESHKTKEGRRSSDTRVGPLGPHTPNFFMFKFPPELFAHKGNVVHLLYVVGGLLVSVTAASQCVDVAVRTAQSPAALLRLSDALIRLMGFSCQIQDGKSSSKRKPNRLYFFESLDSLLDMTKTLQGTFDLKVLNLFPERHMALESSSASSISMRRCRFFYILIAGVRRRTVFILCIDSKSSKLKTFKTADQLQWLIHFGRQAQAQGDVIFLLLSAKTEQIDSRSDGSTNRCSTSRVNLLLSVISVLFLWMYLPHVSVFALIYLGLKVQEKIH